MTWHPRISKSTDLLRAEQRAHDIDNSYTQALYNAYVNGDITKDAYTQIKAMAKQSFVTEL